VITNIWNAEVDRYESGQYIIKNAGWNQDIAVGGAVEFGFSGNENFLGFPSEYSLLGNYTETDENDYMIKYSLSSDWGSGFVGTISITNNTDTTIEDWTLDFDFGRTITNIWDGVLETQEGNHYVVKNAAYNSNIAAGETVSFGFGGISGSKEMEPYGYKLHKYEIKMNYAVAFDAGDPNATNIPEAQFLANGGYVTEPGYPEREGYLFLGWYKDKDFSEYFDFENSTINKDTTLYARWFYYLCETDAEGDGIVDSLEEVIGTSINSNDTDGDGLSDLTEVDILYTDPTMLDTDGNGINDGDEDYDADRLTNKDETEYGTDPAVADTDNDKLSDYDEKVIYGTEPLKADTDEDGVSDGKEIELGTDPLTLQTSFQVSVSSENAGQVKASVDIELMGAQV